MVTPRASSTCRALRFRTSVRTSWRQSKWSAVQNSTWPLSDVTRYPLMTQDAAQFSGAVIFGSGRASPACFTGRRVTPLSGAPPPNPLKRAGKTVSRRALSTGPKALHMPGVTLCTNVHSCWSDFCSLA